MSARKSERLINLLIALLSTRGFLTREEIRGIIEDYRQAPTQAAFERQFERDKDELRSLGIVIETGSDDVLSDDDDGYRIDRSTFELPPMTLTSEELAVLGLAEQVWRGSLVARHTAHAFEALRAGGAEPDPSLIPTLQPQIVSAEPDFDTVYDAVVQRRELRFDYAGRTRRVQPWRLLQRRGQWYLLGFDLDREDERFFKLSRFETRAEPHGVTESFAPPGDLDERAKRLDPPAEAEAIVALRDGVSWAHAEPVEHDAGVPEGYRAHRVRMINEAAILDEVAAAGAEAVLLAPLQLRAQVIDRLREAAR